MIQICQNVPYDNFILLNRGHRISKPCSDKMMINSCLFCKMPINHYYINENYSVIEESKKLLNFKDRKNLGILNSPKGNPHIYQSFL